MANAHHSKEKYIQIASKTRGQKRTQEQKGKISKALMVHKHSPETLAKMRKPRSELGRQNISKAMIGKTPWNKGKTGIYSEETLNKLRVANLGKKLSTEVKTKLRDSMISFFKTRDPLYVAPDYSLGTEDRKHESIRRLRLRTNGGYHTKQQWEFLKGAYEYKCLICGMSSSEIRW